MKAFFIDLGLIAMFIVAVLTCAALLTIYRTGISIKDFFRLINDNGASASASLGIGVILLIAILWALAPGSAYSGSYFNEGGVFLGIDDVWKGSPQCKDGGPDNRLTSNLGMWQNIWRSDSNRVDVNAKYTHHSCVFGADRNTYDAFGVELKWKLWGK